MRLRVPFRTTSRDVTEAEHIAVFQANWNDKATNIQAIANEIALGLESLVFWTTILSNATWSVRRAASRGPGNAGRSGILYPHLERGWLFRSRHVFQRGSQTGQLLRWQARRADLQKQVGNVLEYLASLQMEIIFRPFDETGRARITQLISKSNQFNLTTRRYTEAEVAGIETDPKCFSMQVRLTDSFGDNGMISVVICRRLG